MKHRNIVVAAILLLSAGLSHANPHGGFRTALIIKPVNETVTDSTVYQDDDALLGYMACVSTYLFTMSLHFTSASGVPDAKFKFIEPAVGSTITAHCLGEEAPSNFAHYELHSFGAEIVLAIGAGGETELNCEGVVEVHPTSCGTFKVQWAQNTANAAGTTLKRGSYYTLQRFGL